MLAPGNVWSMDYAIRHLPSDHPLLEIGSFAGLSTKVICYLLPKHGRVNVLFTCDNWDVTGQQRTDRIAGSDRDYTEAIRLDPRLVLAHYNRAIVYDRTGEKAKAQADYGRARELGYTP